MPTPPPQGVRDARAAFTRRLGSRVAVVADPATGATRAVQPLDGALTGPAAGPRADVARAWVRDNRALFGLDAADVDALATTSTQTAGQSGLTTVRLAQRYRGVAIFDGGLEVTLDRGGRVLAANGEPVADPDVASVTPQLDADAARAKLDAVSGPTTPAGAAALTLFPAAGGTRLAWRLIQRRSSTETLDAVVDASTGALLFRQNLTKSDAPSTFLPRYPGAEDDPALAGAAAPQDVDLQAAGYLPAGATTLSGPYARAFSDVNDDDVAQPGEEVAPAPDTGFRFAFTPAASCPAGPMVPAPRCTWDPSVSTSWMANRKQNAVQAFTLVNRYHDHLESPPIAFGADGFAGDDPVILNTLDGAQIQDAAHVNNANMTVLPQGSSPKLQMYLFKGPQYRAIDGGDDATTVWHEYTHGLSGRLVTHPDGTSALASAEAGALSEAWSDFYALDFAARQGLQPDTDTPGEMDFGAYSDLVPHSTRSQAADCPVGAPAAACPGHGTAGSGGYTLGDFGKIRPGPEIHYDGEIWLETLWDARRALVANLGSESAGSDAIERLVTDGMRLTPAEPSLIDARNAILAADTAAGSTFHALLWRVFAQRGLGYFASVAGATDTKPVEDFTEPPGPGAAGTVSGVVTDAGGGLPLAGVDVGPTLPEGDAPHATTGADGRYSLSLPPGTYPRLRFSGPAGYDADVQRVVVPAGGAVTADRALRRDWASSAGGATLANDPGGVCGPSQLLDETDGSGWSAPVGGAAPSITITLPTAIDVTQIGIDPAATCGDGPASALARYRVEALRDSGDQTMLDGSFGAGDADGDGIDDDDRRLNLRTPVNARGVTRLRLTLLAPRGASPYVDISQLSVYGTRSDGAPRGALRATPATAAVQQAITFDASSFTDPDSVISSYVWDFDGDGQPDRTTSTPTTTFAFASAGARDARVTVRDVGGTEGQASAQVRVIDPGAPAAPATTPTPAPPAAPIPDPPGPATGSSNPPPPAAAPIVSVAKRSRSSAAVVVRCASRCGIEATATLGATARRRLGLRSSVSLSGTVPAATRRTLRIPLTKRVLAAARRRRLHVLVLAVEVRVTDTARRTTHRRVTVRITL